MDEKSVIIDRKGISDRFRAYFYRGSYLVRAGKYLLLFSLSFSVMELLFYFFGIFQSGNITDKVGKRVTAAILLSLWFARDKAENSQQPGDTN